MVLVDLSLFFNLFYVISVNLLVLGSLLVVLERWSLLLEWLSLLLEGCDTNWWSDWHTWHLHVAHVWHVTWELSVVSTTIEFWLVVGLHILKSLVRWVVDVGVRVGLRLLLELLQFLSFLFGHSQGDTGILDGGLKEILIFLGRGVSVIFSESIFA